jgi:hypothetical protein
VFITAILHGKHDDNSTADGHKPDRPVPLSTPDDGGSGGGKHERDDKQ